MRLGTTYLYNSWRGSSENAWSGAGTLATHVLFVQLQGTGRKTAEQAAEEAGRLAMSTSTMAPCVGTRLTLAARRSPPRDNTLPTGTLLGGDGGALKGPSGEREMFRMVPFVGRTEATDAQQVAGNIMLLFSEPAYRDQQQEQQQQEHQQQHHPLGSMFRPEIPKQGVVSVVSEVLCRPGFTSGPEDAKRLLRSIRTGRVDVRTMCRLLRWFGGGRTEEQLRERGLAFVGPGADGVGQSYTTGLGMTRLLEQVCV